MSLDKGAKEIHFALQTSFRLTELFQRCMWYMNHYNGAILNPEGKIWLDQGWCIGSAGIAWGIVRFQGDFTQFFLAAPTLLCCLIGGALAGITIWMMRSCGNRLSKEEDAV